MLIKACRNGGLVAAAARLAGELSPSM